MIKNSFKMYSVLFIFHIRLGPKRSICTLTSRGGKVKKSATIFFSAARGLEPRSRRSICTLTYPWGKEIQHI